MFAKPKSTTFTINARDPVPDPPGHEIKREQRLPPKVYTRYRDCNGYSPGKIQKMIEKKKQYQLECEIIQTQAEIDRFEAKQRGLKDAELPPIPQLPIPPQDIDNDVLRSFEPPSATRFFDIITPSTRPKSAVRQQPKDDAKSTCSGRCIHHGCPCCNPDRMTEAKPRTRPATRNGATIHREERPKTPNKRDDLPMQMNQAYWNVLDEPSIPRRPKSVYKEYKKPNQFCKLRTGPRPAGIPICVNDLMTSRARGQAKFEEEMSRKRDRELYQREKTIHERAMTSRELMNDLSTRTREIAAESGQKWAVYGTATEKVRPKSVKSSRRPKEKISKEDLESLAQLARIDERMHQERQAKKRPTDEMELFLEQSGIRRRNNTVRDE